jgi:GTP-binding protein
MSINNISKLFRKETKFIAGAAKASQIPHSNFLPEIAFVGKSNVGKSSLINTICNHRGLARVSRDPGRTQQINFFSVADKMILADLPGYGYAKVPISMRQEWELLITNYLQNSINLKLVNLLIDARRGIQKHDARIAQLLLDYNREFQIIFTKIDKVNSDKELINECKNFLASLSYSCNVICTSSRSNYGAKELQASLAKYIES